MKAYVLLGFDGRLFGVFTDPGLAEAAKKRVRRLQAAKGLPALVVCEEWPLDRLAGEEGADGAA